MRVVFFSSGSPMSSLALRAIQPHVIRVITARGVRIAIYRKDGIVEGMQPPLRARLR